MTKEEADHTVVMPDELQMCCLRCGYIAEKNEPYEIEYPNGDNGEGFPICQKCGGWNIGGYDSYSEWGILAEDHQEWVLEGINCI